MAMTFLVLNDLKTYCYQQYIDESSADFVGSRDESEKQNIATIKSKLAGRYDVAEIFSQTGANRNSLIVKVLTIMVIYDILRRNKARKLPEDVKTDYKWVTDWLNDVRDYKENPTDLPAIIDDETGLEVKAAITGNNSNRDFYI